MLVGVGDRIRVERADTEHREAVIGQPAGVILGRLATQAGNAVAQNMFPPLDFLFDGCLHHVENQFFIVESGEFPPDFADEVGEDSDVREFITADIGDHPAGGKHLHPINQGIEESEAIVEIDRFEKEVGHDAAEEFFIRRLCDEVLVYLADVFVALEQHGIGAPEIVDLIPFFAFDNGFEDGGVRLRMDGFLVGLDGEDQIHLRGRDIVGKMRQIDGLDGVEKDEKR